MSTPARVLVTGVTGYVGGQLVPQLLQAGYPVRVMARDPQGLQGRSWVEQVEIVQGDVLEPATLSAALVGVDVAYYLIHSILQGAN
ncbi:MAG: NAD(P)H-binding protein, partial [Ktedonobacterales bacterium]